MSPRLPRGALLAAVLATMAASTVMAAIPATAGPVTRGQAGAAAADKIRGSEWWLSRLQVTQAWSSSRGAGVTVALLSTGVLSSHPDLTGSVVTGPDFTGSGETAASTTWGIEGTSAASIIAGHGDNTGDASGIIGIAPAARILSIRVAFDAADALNASSSAVGRLPEAIAEGIQYAVAHGAKVIDLPLDPSTLASDGAATAGLAAAAGGSAAERSAISDAISKGVVVVAPAGDNGADSDVASFPASYPGVIALGAVDQHGNRADFSTRQSYVAMTAPGVGITTASRPSGYRTMSTTDAASAMGAGVAALIRARYPSLTVSQVRQAMIKGSSAPPASGTAGDGAGTLDALKAMQAAAAIAAPTPTARPSTPAAARPVPVTARPLTSAAKPSTVGMARSALRDAAVAAGALIVLLLGVLLGLRLWRRRAEQETRSAPEPRTLLNAPTGPPSGPLPIQPSSARHARAIAAEAAPAPTWTPAPPRSSGAWPGPGAGAGNVGRAPDSVSPRFAPPGVRPPEPDRPEDEAADDTGAEATPPGRGRIRNRGRGGRSGSGNRISGHSMRLRVNPDARTATRSQVSAPGGPPWAPAAAPADDGLLPEPPSPAADQFRPPAPPAPVAGAAGSPWDAAPPGFGALPQRDPDAIPDAAIPPGAIWPGAIWPGAESMAPAEEQAPTGWRPIPPAGAPLPQVPAPPAPQAPPVPAGEPEARPISPLDRLPLSEPAQSRFPDQPGFPDQSAAPPPRPGDSPSGPLYIWNPAALTEPFPATPETGHPGDDEDPRRP